MELPDRIKLERRFGDRIYELHKRHAAELRAILDGDPSAFVPYTFWDKVRRENETELVAILLLLFGISANYHTAQAGFRYAPLKSTIELKGRYWAMDRGRLVGAAMSQTAQKRLGQAVTRLQASSLAPPIAIEIPSPLVTPSTSPLATLEIPSIAVAEPEVIPAFEPGPELDAVINQIFSEAHADFVAMSETTAAQSAGGDEAVSLTVGISILDRWRTNPGRLPGSLKLSRSGPCPTCKPMDGIRRTAWIDPRGPGPWIHPGCVCDVLYHNIESAT